jgi:valyl-tRNA synthetase
VGGFDLVLELPQGQQDAQRKRLEKEREQLAKNIANSKRQLSDEAFLGKAPPQVVVSIRHKLADYEDQLRRVEGALGGPS